jgi:hypothetical protein
MARASATQQARVMRVIGRILAGLACPMPAGSWSPGRSVQASPVSWCSCRAASASADEPLWMLVVRGVLLGIAYLPAAKQ